MRIRPAARRLGSAASSDTETWEQRAACGPADADRLTSDDTDVQAAAAAEICRGRRCPVMVECLTEGWRYPLAAGVWGGTTAGWRSMQKGRMTSRAETA